MNLSYCFHNALKSLTNGRCCDEAIEIRQSDTLDR